MKSQKHRNANSHTE